MIDFFLCFFAGTVRSAPLHVRFLLEVVEALDIEVTFVATQGRTGHEHRLHLGLGQWGSLLRHAWLEIILILFLWGKGGRGWRSAEYQCCKITWSWGDYLRSASVSVLLPIFVRCSCGAWSSSFAFITVLVLQSRRPCLSLAFIFGSWGWLVPFRSALIPASDWSVHGVKGAKSCWFVWVYWWSATSLQWECVFLLKDGTQVLKYVLLLIWGQNHCVGFDSLALYAESLVDSPVWR